MPFPGIYPPPLPCDAPPEAVAVELAAALEAYGRAVPDLATFYASAARANGKVGCLQAPLPPAATAELYEVQAILAYVQKDADTATAFLRGAHDAGGALPGEITKNTPRLAEIERGSAGGRAAPRPLVTPEGTTLLVDGAVALAAPTDRPYLLQVQWADGKVHWSGLIPQDTTPDLARLAPPQPAPPPQVCPPVVCDPCPTCPDVSRRPSTPLTLGAIGVSVAGAGLYGLSAFYNQRFYEQAYTLSEAARNGEVDDPTLAATERRANLAQVAALGVGAVGLGLDVTVAVQWIRAGRR